MRDYVLRSSPGLLRENVRDHYGGRIRPIDNAPVGIALPDPQLMTSTADGRHGPRVWHRQTVSKLYTAKQRSRLDPCFPRERRRFYLGFEPHQRPLAQLPLSKYVEDDIYTTELAVNAVFGHGSDVLSIK